MSHSSVSHIFKIYLYVKEKLIAIKEQHFDIIYSNIKMFKSKVCFKKKGEKNGMEEQVSSSNAHRVYASISKNPQHPFAASASMFSVTPKILWS